VCYNISLLFLIKEVISSSLLINLEPILTPFFGCYINIIVYAKFDLRPPMTPLVLSTPKFNHYANNSRCAGLGTVTKVGTVFVRNQENFCGDVFANYLTKGITCVSVIALFPTIMDKEDDDIYWYLNHYWSRAEFQERIIFNQTWEPLLTEFKHPPIFPPRIYLQSIVSSEVFKTKKDAGIRLHSKHSWESLPREWASYSLLPKLTLVLTKKEFHTKRILIPSTEMYLSLPGYTNCAEISRLIGAEYGMFRILF